MVAVVSPGRGDRSDRGSVAPWLLAAVIVLAGVGLVVMLLLGLVVAHRRAVAAADLAALSGAASLRDSPWAACRAAGSAAAANRARLVSCRSEGSSVVVTVAVPWVALLVPEVTATARAGVAAPPA